ncbi:DUF4178 domain-containing protein [Synechococcus sp. CCY 9618]|uniref:DUF4178 domain-containing protein n=1 Tax=Synechococcus sp. CCY 9618 TaxID=2815602 RepID=UPI001C223584|nr:DUF4178 domain-containing protein [Synechococcus sp. CCY 9618]
MAVWFILPLLLLVAVALLLMRRQRLRRTAPKLQARTLFTLTTGDIVQYEGRDWVVEDRLLYDDAGFQWLEYLLRDGDDGRWLSVCEDDWLEVGWLEDVPAGELQGLTGDFPPRLRCRGQLYTLKETGRASVTTAARVMNRRLQGCRYGDYEGEDGRMLSLERWDDGVDPGPPELSLGRRIDPAAPVLLPGDGHSVYR